MSRGPLLIVCGLKREAAIAAALGTRAVVGGASRPALEERLAALGDAPFRGVLSFGLAGALVADLEPGTVVTPWRVHDPDGRMFDASREWMTRWLPVFDTPGGAPALPWRALDLAGSDVPLLTRSAKRDLAQGGASAVDMESHVAAAYAERRGLPFAAVRAISDPSDRDLPPLAGKGMRLDGSMAVWPVVAGLARDPGQLPGLLRTARDAGAAFRALGRVRGLLGPGFGLYL